MVPHELLVQTRNTIRLENARLNTKTETLAFLERPSNLQK